MVEFKGHACDELPVDEDFNLDVLVGDFVGSEADQEGSGFICSIFMFNDDCIADAGEYSIFFEGAAHDLSGFHTGFEKKHECLWKIDFYYKCSTISVYMKPNLIFLFGRIVDKWKIMKICGSGGRVSGFRVPDGKYFWGGRCFEGWFRSALATWLLSVDLQGISCFVLGIRVRAGGCSRAYRDFSNRFWVKFAGRFCQTGRRWVPKDCSFFCSWTMPKEVL